MNEKVFQQELKHDLRERRQAFCEKIPDFPVSQSERMVKDAQGRSKKIRFSPPKIIDLVGTGVPLVPGTYGIPLWWECKQMRTLNAWPLVTLDDNQLRILLEQQSYAAACVIVNYRLRPNANQIEKYGLSPLIRLGRINVLTRVLPSAILEARDRGWKSIPASQLLSRATAREPGGWTFEQVMQAVWEPQWDNSKR
jgi:hypothetical protein